jgi:hypothetical protein
MSSFHDLLRIGVLLLERNFPEPILSLIWSNESLSTWPEFRPLMSKQPKTRECGWIWDGYGFVAKEGNKTSPESNHAALVWFSRFQTTPCGVRCTSLDIPPHKNMLFHGIYINNTFCQLFSPSNKKV